MPLGVNGGAAAVDARAAAAVSRPWGLPRSLACVPCLCLSCLCLLCLRLSCPKVSAYLSVNPSVCLLIIVGLCLSHCLSIDLLLCPCLRVLVCLKLPAY